MTKVSVSDHAVLRYLQRVHGVDVEAVRGLIAGRAATAVQLGALAVKIDGVKLVLAGSVVVTALPAHQFPRWPAAPVTAEGGDG